MRGYRALERLGAATHRTPSARRSALVALRASDRKQRRRETRNALDVMLHERGIGALFDKPHNGFARSRAGAASATDVG